MNQASFVSENARLDRAYLAGEVGEFVRSQAKSAHKEIKGGLSKESNNGKAVGRNIYEEVVRDTAGT